MSKRNLACLLSLLVIFGCEKNDSLQEGSDLFKLAKALSIKYTILHPDSNAVLARTNKFDYTTTDLLRDMHQVQGNKVHELKLLSPNAMRERIAELAEDYTMRRVLLTRAAAVGVSVTSSEVDSSFMQKYGEIIGNPDFDKYLKRLGLSMDDLRDEIKRQLRIKKYIEVELADSLQVTEEEIREDYARDQTATVRHILLSTAGKRVSEKQDLYKRMEALLARARNGEDFAQLAREYSEDGNSRNTGGLYQDLKRGTMASPFDETAFSVPVGAISDIVETEYGYHIIKVLDRKHETRPYEEVRDEIAQKLRQIKLANVRPGFLERLKQEVGFQLVVET